MIAAMATIIPRQPRSVHPDPALPAPSAWAGGFDQRVYAAVARIPFGQLATYGQIAELLGAWGCARQVGWALRRLPLPSAIPWHRVVNASGRISMTPSREGSDWIQRDLLLAEGIAVAADGRLPLALHRWQAALPPASGSAPG
jgi:methylated-DNA-protein-cysteine methyltransferase-like protein